VRPVSAAAGDRDALDRLLGVPEMAWLVRRVRDRILAAEGEALAGVVQLSTPTAEQRDAAVKLVGRPRRAGVAALRLDLADVEAILRRGPWPAGLADAVVTLTGPVADREAERESEAAAWAEARAVMSVAAVRFPGLAEWWDEWCLAGGLKRAARSEATRLGVTSGPEVAEQLVGQLADVLSALPAAGVPLAVFARQVVGDAHGLDEARSLGRLARAVVGAAFGPGAEPPKELSRRDAWASAGVVMSNVSSTVLSLGVPGSRGGGRVSLGAATASALEAMRAACAPVLLTLDQVRSGGVAALPHDGVVHVCENPTVVEVAARRWGARQLERAPAPSPVLVCTSGQPSTAVVELLEILTADGAGCRYHGDFDWAGLRIARVVRSRVPWTPWRFTAADYQSATRQDMSSLGLVGGPVEAPWDPDLAPAMARMDRAVEEEAVADLLAADLLGYRPDVL
jgi:uncharacterized protein (TIGR02679 family)